MSAKLEQKTKKTAPDNWEITANRFVVFIDIMGFKDMVARNSHEDIYKKLQSISDNIKDIEKLEGLMGNKKIFITMFSDSLCLFSNDDSIKSFRFILFVTRLIFAQTMESLVPMKGAIAYGKISIDKKRQIYFGQPIIDAFLLQEDVNYYGVIFHNTVDKYMKDHIFPEKLNFFFEAKTTLKSGRIAHKNLNWFSMYSPRNENITNKESLVELFENLKSNVSGSPRKYIDNTEEMMELSQK